MKSYHAYGMPFLWFWFWVDFWSLFRALSTVQSGGWASVLPSLLTTPSLPSASKHGPPPLSSWCDHVIPLCFVFTVLWLSRCCSQLKHGIDVMTFSSLTTFWFPGVNNSHVAFCSIFYVLTTHPSPGCCPVVRIFLPVQCSSPEKGGGEDTFCETSVVWKLLWCAYTLLLISMLSVNFPSQFWKFDLLSLSFHYCC